MASSPAVVVSPTPASGPHVAGPARATGPDAPEPTSLARIIESRNHRPMLRLQALQILEGICRSLDQMHRNGGLHGDVQPEKIFVTAEGHVRLTGHGGGPTAAYASCEVLEGLPPAASDDLFAAACTGYLLLAGEPAFGTGTALEAEAAARRPVRIAHLSPGQWRALERALAFRRADRQPDVETFLNELRWQYPGQAGTDATASLPVLPAAGPGDRQGPRLPLAAAGITGIAAIIMALGWWLLRTPEAPAPASPLATETTEPEAGLIMRSEVLPVVDAAAVTPAARPAGPKVPQAMPARSPPAASVQTPASGSGTETAPAPPAAAPDAAAEPALVANTAPEPALIAPLPVVPSVSAEAALAITLPATPADGDTHMVPFSSLRVRRYVEPDYPRDSKGVRTAGWVDVSFGIDAVGRTTGLQVNGAEPAGVFEDAALAAVRRWRFAPVEAPAGSGKEVRSEVRVRFVPD